MTVSLFSGNAVTWEPTYYVSGQNGNDTWSGLLPFPNSSFSDGPFQTIRRTQAAIRASSTIKAATLRTGTYSIASGWQFGWEDNGAVWISFPGEAATIDGEETGTVDLTGVRNVTLMGLTFLNLGRGGANLNGDSRQVAIRWNKFLNCNTSCISGAGASDLIIDSNTFWGQYPGNPAGNTGNAYAALMLWYGSSNNRITHNLIGNCQGGGIAFSAGPDDPPNDNNVVDRNILRDVNTSVRDQGAIYMMDRSHRARGNQITNNFIDGNGGTGYRANATKAIYLDDLMSNVLVSGNICRNCGQYAWQVHAGDHNRIANNIFDLSSAGTLLGLYQNLESYTDYGMDENIIENNIVYFSGDAPLSLYRVSIGPSDALPAVSNNVYYSTAAANIPNGRTIFDARPVYANPQFADPGSGAYVMPSSSPAYTSIQFQPLPLDLGPVPYAP
jgi:hypothetical protein